MQASANLKRATRVALWALVCWVVIFWRMSYLPLIDPDEAHYAQITREMRSLGDYLVPRIDGVPIIDKPALFHWLQAGSFAIFGETEFGARFPTGMAALALLGITYWFGRRLFGSETAERGALMLAMTPLTFVLASFAIFDMVFNAFLFGAFALLVVSALENRPKLQIPGFILLSLAVQIKGPFVLIVVVATAMLAAFSKETRPLLRRIHWFTGLTAAVVLALPWFILMLRRFGQQFIDGYILYNNVQLFAAPLYRRSFYPFFYVRVALAAMFPWTLVCLGGLIDGWRHRQRGELFEPRRVMLWAWIAVIFGFFSASRFKLDHYIYPLAPAACLLAADAWQSASNDSTHRYRFTSWSLVLTGLVLAAIGVVGGVALATVDLNLPIFSAAIFAAISIGGLSWVGYLLTKTLRPSRAGWPLVATLLVLYSGVVLVGFPVFKETRPGADLGVWLQSRADPTDHIVIYRQGRWKASLRFYAQHPVQQTELSEELLATWTSPGRTYAVMIESDVEALRQAGLPIIEVHSEPAVIGTKGRYLRTQIWGKVVIVTNRQLKSGINSPN